MAASDSEQADRAWDVSDDANPQPLIWPECSECHVAYVWRRAFSLTGAGGWYYFRDCKHKSADAVLVTKDGPYEPSTS